MEYRIGIDLGGSKIEGIVLARDFKIVKRIRVSTPKGDYLGTLEAIERLVHELETSVNKTKIPVGIGIPGAASPKTGLVKNANSVCLIGNPLQKDLESKLKRPIKLENDANCFVVSEASDGAAQNAPVVFGVILGTGVGGGICIDKKVISGANRIAGEWGHNPLPWPQENELPGPKCYCGKNGCIEAFLSGPALESEFHQLQSQSFSAKEINEKLDLDNSTHLTLMNTYCDRLARSLAVVINILDPDLIVLGGGISNFEYLYKKVPQNWSKYIFSNDIQTKLVRNAHGDSSGVRGAAWLNPF